MTVLQDSSIGPALYSSAELSETVDRLAGEIAADYRGKPLVLLGVLKGAICFISDLARGIAAKNGPELTVDYVCVERYKSAGFSGSPPRLALDTRQPLSGANVVLVDGIADNGTTLNFLGRLLEGRGPASLRTCVLIDKHAPREVDLRIDYRGLRAPNCFVIGYGLDYQEQYRNLPYVAELREGQTV